MRQTGRRRKIVNLNAAFALVGGKISENMRNVSSDNNFNKQDESGLFDAHIDCVFVLQHTVKASEIVAAKHINKA